MTISANLARKFEMIYDQCLVVEESLMTSVVETKPPLNNQDLFALFTNFHVICAIQIMLDNITSRHLLQRFIEHHETLRYW